MSQPIHACPCCDAWLDLPGLHVIDVNRDDRVVVVTVASDLTELGCPSCGVLARVHDTRTVSLIDAPAMGTPMRLRWVKHRYVCREHLCDKHTFTEADPHIARAGHLLTRRATGWAIEQLRHEHASISGLARQLGVDWKTLWRAIEPALDAAARDASRFEGVKRLGVDEHVWHHCNPKVRGPKMLTGLVDFTPAADGTPRTRFLDLVPGGSGTVLADWLQGRGQACLDQAEIAALDPFRGYKNAIDDHLDDATAVRDSDHPALLGREPVRQAETPARDRDRCS